MIVSYSHCVKCCKPENEMESLAKSGWIFATEGELVNCPKEMAAIGFCGSNQGADCSGINGGKVNFGVRCAPLKKCPPIGPCF